MGAIQDLFRTHGPAYLARFASSMPGNHNQVMEAIMGCRTPANGALLYQCEACPQQQLLARCCGNRHCPGCQQHKAYAWLARQLERQLPTHHFLLTFTVPEPLRAFIRGHQRIAYGALFEASAGAIKTLAPDPKFLGADCPGFLGVLHTWGRQLQYHPHIHYLVPGGAVSSQDGRWHASSPGFYLPVHALSKIFRAKFRDAMDAAGLLGQIPSEVWDVDWNVNCQAVGSGQATLHYLARYVFKVAISDSRIVRFDDKEVVFRYRKSHSNRCRTMALPITEFIRRFLQHVLPTGFMKVRYYGFLSPSFATPFDQLKARIEMAQGFALHDPHNDIERPAPPPPLCCRHCGGRLRYQRTILAPRVRLHALLASPPMTTPASG
ncbi:MAG: IS91 family transposase [bacterium]